MEDKGRLIDAYNAVIKISGKVTPIPQKHGSKPRGIYLAVLEALAECPTVDAVEAVHGRWAKTDILSRHMGVGVRYYNHAECKVAPCRLVECEYDYCPFCGAKMDGERKDNVKKRKMLGEYPACDHLNVALRKLLDSADENRVAIEEIVYAITKANGYIHDDVKDALVKNNILWFGERRVNEYSMQTGIPQA